MPGGDTLGKGGSSYGGGMAGAGSLIGTGIQSMSMVKQGQLTAAGYTSQAKALEMAAAEVRKRRKYEMWRNEVYGRRLVGQQMNTFGALGVELQGTAIQDLADTMRELTLEKLMVARNAKAEATAYDVAAKDFRTAAKKTKRAATIGAFGNWMQGVFSTGFGGK